jgi:rfaE bifunctional protein kinase chain/domain
MNKGLHHILPSFDSLRVLVIGDIMLDRYLRGSVGRQSPEADVDVLDHSETTSKIGGAGNVALNFKALGAATSIISIIGDDKSGLELKDLLEKEGVDHCLIKDIERPTTVKTRIIADDQHLLRIDFEKTKAISSKIEAEVLAKTIDQFETALPDIIVLQDYNKGLLTSSLIKKIINHSKERDVFISVDPKKENFWAYRGVDLFKPNLRETEEALSSELKENSAWVEAANQLKSRLHAKNVVVTLSEHGILLLNDDSCKLVPTDPVEIVDVCGAGDAVLAILSVLLHLGVDFEQCGLWANKVGAQICQTSGVSTIRKESLH